MSFASPERLIWLAVALPIIGFYILRTRLRRRNVATLLFWDQVFEEKRQRSLWQSLRHWLSLLLQLIFVGLLGFALADPRWRSQTDSGQELILVVDNSASMQTVDQETGRSRLEEAVKQAGDVAKGLRQGDQIALIAAGTSVRVIVGMTDFAPAIEEALQTIATTDGPTKVEQAIEAARRLASDPDRRRIVVFSDVCLPVRESIPASEDLRWVQVGSSQDNLAITMFQVRRSTVDPIGYALLIEVQNFSDQRAETRLKLELDQSLVDVIPLSIEPNDRWQTTIDGTSREGGVLEGTIDLKDGLLVDNIARAIVPTRPLIPVTLVLGADSPSFYLRTVLQSIPLVELKIVEASGSVDPNPKGLTVFGGVSPASLPAGPTLIVAADKDGPIHEVDGQTERVWKLGESIESPIIAKQNKESPLLRHVQLQNVILDGGRDIEVSESIGEATTLLETADGSRVLVSVERASGRVLILATDLDASDLPLRIAFPVMMTNAMNWFFRQTGEMNPALSTGQVESIAWDFAGENDEATLIDPSGIQRVVTVDKKQAVIGPIDNVGVFGLFLPTALPEREENEEPLTPDAVFNQSAESVGELLAVNLCDASESDLRLPELSQQVAGDPPPRGAPAWFYLVLCAIGLVIGEWVLFNRRVVA